MAKAEIVDFPVSALPDRYGKARSAVYTQMNKLDITPYKQGNKSFISNIQLQMLDDLNDFLNEDTGRDIDDFIRERRVRTPTQRRTQKAGQLAKQQAGQPFLQVNGLNELNYTLSNHITSLKERFELLDAAAAKGWLLSTSDLAGLCGVLPDSLTKRDQFQRWGFTFIKRPDRTGQEVSWQVKAPHQQK
jgi:hypothetical protein